MLYTSLVKAITGKTKTPDKLEGELKEVTMSRHIKGQIGRASCREREFPVV